MRRLLSQFRPGPWQQVALLSLLEPARGLQTGAAWTASGRNFGSRCAVWPKCSTLMNHAWFADMASTDVTNAAFGRLNPTQRNLPRFIKLVMHLHW